MKRRGLLLAGLATAVVVAVVGGLAATAFDPGDSDVPKPSGAETRLRVQPQQDEVPCGDKHEVDVFLDDLEMRPSPDKEGVSRGLAAFQVTLRYDPSIVRVAAADVRMSPLLESTGTAGGRRAFIRGPTTVDNLEGYVFFGAVGIPQGEPFDPDAEGPDPVAKNEPIPLFTLSFQTVGEGTSPLTVYSEEESESKIPIPGTKFLDYQTREYTPLAVEKSSLTVAAGDCGPLPPVTPRPRPTPALPPFFVTATPVVAPTTVVVTPVPAVDAGRPDCPEGWNAYDDPDGHFAVCYPAGWTALTSHLTSESGRSVSLSNRGPGSVDDKPYSMFITLAWRSPRERPYLEATHCSSLENVWAVPAERIEMEVAGAKAEGCRALGTSSYVDEGTLELLVPSDADGGVIEVWVGRAGPEMVGAEALMQQILATLRLGEAQR